MKIFGFVKKVFFTLSTAPQNTTRLNAIPLNCTSMNNQSKT